MHQGPDTSSSVGATIATHLDRVLSFKDRPSLNTPSGEVLLQQSDAHLGATLREWLKQKQDQEHEFERPDASLATNPPLSAGEEQAPTNPPADSILPGERCGPFKIEKRLGKGGMGTVFLASRLDDLDLKVALKTLSRWDPRMQILLQRECKILSGLNHTNIAHLIDAGVLPTGQPWLAMEYIAGTTLDVFLESHPLNLEKRLELFLKICDALGHAHAQMVIHRDLKPKNIMIKPNGEPKLLDFGIARMLDPETQAQQTMTALSDQIMTPEYASPEQIRGERLNASTDVYSAGVLLYELLTGTRPYQFKSHDFFTILQTVQEHPLTRPSSHAQAGGTIYKEMARHLKGDLDTIVLKALAFAPKDRYPTIAALAHDIQLYQRGMPIEARPATRSYRLRKFVARHQGPVVLGAGSLIFLLLFSIYASIQQTRLTRERDLATKEQRTTAQVTQFLVSLFDQADPHLSLRNDLSAYDLLERGRLQVSQTLQDEPEINNRLLATLGRVYRGMGHVDQSKSLLTQALENHKTQGTTPYELELELFETLLMNSDFDEAEARLDTLKKENQQDNRRKARLEHAYGRLCLKTGRFMAAQNALASAELLHHHLPQDEGLMLRRDQGNLQAAMSDYNSSIQTQKKLLTREKRYFGKDHIRVADSQTTLALTYMKKGDYEEADACLQQAEKIYLRAFGKNHLSWASLLHSRAKLYRHQGKYTQAKTYLDEALSIARNQRGENSLMEAEILTTLGLNYYNNGTYQRAEQTTRKAIQIMQFLFGKEHIKVANNLINLALIHQAQGAHQEAKILLRETLEIYRKKQLNNHPVFGKALNNLAIHHARQGDLEQAEVLFLRTLAFRTETLGETHPSIADALGNLGAFYSGQRNFKKSKAYHMRSLSQREQLFGRDHPDVAMTFYNLAILSERENRLDDAVARYEEVVAIYERLQNEAHLTSRLAKRNLALIQITMGDFETAERQLNRILSWAHEKEGPKSFHYMEVKGGVGLLNLQRGRLDEAESHYLEALTIAQSLFKRPHNSITHFHFALLDVFLAQDQLDKATQIIQIIEQDLATLQQENLAERLAYQQATLQQKTGNKEAAYQALKAIWEVSPRPPWRDHYLEVGVLLNLADLESDLGTPNQALSLLEKARVRLEIRLPPSHHVFQQLQSIKGKALARKNDASARRVLQSAHQELAQKLGKDHPYTEQAKLRLATLPVSQTRIPTAKGRRP
ncbi:serine/threonine-protein kinase [Acanthopleuribacter pedis]|uniref:Serine/threonine protein kinase n=1 Tax=Acanthopleuribacter pedis TaxID=442870 RepID=A0A8J7U495_9BACT|nr:serine/threonine-protein kinase [Acanthopleuribacter pedis]MBO1321258.1 serine/threonine protein kinase [Acanthopleuribacter pedis]